MKIDRLRIYLPPGFERGAARIARLAGEALAQEQPAGPYRADVLRVHTGPLSATAGGRATAATIARSVRNAILAPGQPRPGAGGGGRWRR